MGCRLRVTKSTMVVFQRDGVGIAESAKAIGILPRKMPSHSRNSAEFRKTEAPFEAGIFLAQEAIVKIDIMRDENTLAHKFKEVPCNFSEDWSTAHHVVSNSRQLRDPERNRTLRIQKGMPFAYNLMISDLDRTYLSDPVGR